MVEWLETVIFVVRLLLFVVITVVVVGRLYAVTTEHLVLPRPRARTHEDTRLYSAALSTWLWLPLVAYGLAVVTNIGTTDAMSPERREAGITMLLLGALGLEAAAIVALVVEVRRARRRWTEVGYLALLVEVDARAKAGIRPDPAWLRQLDSRLLELEAGRRVLPRRREREAAEIVGAGVTWRTLPRGVFGR